MGKLLKTVELASNRKIFYPLMTYCYFLDLQVSLQSLLLDPTFTSECELWKTRASDDFLRDVYDGNVWKKFMDYDGVPFLRDDNVYALLTGFSRTNT